jgi:hypothetical protein
VVTEHAPPTQQAPVGGGGHGLGLQVPPFVQAPVQFTAGVTVQLPLTQHEPLAPMGVQLPQVA